MFMQNPFHLFVENEIKKNTQCNARGKTNRLVLILTALQKNTLITHLLKEAASVHSVLLKANCAL